MAGVYTENQPDFAWLMPYEEKQFVQYFMPYREIGIVKQASKDFVMNIEEAGEGQVTFKILATSKQRVRIILDGEAGDEYYNKNLVEEIQIKSFKMYNKGNNFSNDKTTSGCSVFRNTVCCIII